MHQRSKNWLLIEEIIAWQCNLRGFLNTRMLRGSNCCTEHWIKSTTILRVRRGMRTERKPIGKLATNSIMINKVKNELQASQNHRRSDIPAGTVEEKWDALKSIIYKLFKEKLSISVRKEEDRFGGNNLESEELINNRNLLRNCMLSRNIVG